MSFVYNFQWKFSKKNVLTFYPFSRPEDIPIGFLSNKHISQLLQIRMQAILFKCTTPSTPTTTTSPTPFHDSFKH